jgi:hypothetical protein
MPTPFYHLSVAEELLNHPELQSSAYQLLGAQRGAFLFGNTAPDVQVISRQAREDTHFFDLPIRKGSAPPWEQVFSAYPRLANAAALTDSQVAFLTGYLCHLQADWLWVKSIFVPVFGMLSPWGTFPERLYLHNVLRAYLDRQILPSLTNGTRSHLAEIYPSGWLPFVADKHLRQWRDFLLEQMQPEGAIQTVEVFAARQGIAPADFYHLLDSEDEMDRQVFNHIRRPSLDEYRQHLVEENLQLIHSYLSPRENPVWRSNPHESH